MDRIMEFSIVQSFVSIFLCCYRFAVLRIMDRIMEFSIVQTFVSIFPSCHRFAVFRVMDRIMEFSIVQSFVSIFPRRHRFGVTDRLKFSIVGSSVPISFTFFRESRILPHYHRFAVFRIMESAIVRCLVSISVRNFKIFVHRRRFVVLRIMEFARSFVSIPPSILLRQISCIFSRSHRSPVFRIVHRPELAIVLTLVPFPSIFPRQS